MVQGDFADLCAKKIFARADVGRATNQAYPDSAKLLIILIRILISTIWFLFNITIWFCKSHPFNKNDYPSQS